ncbi:MULTISPECIES: helicase-related protein [unclassified Vibrio]|uniref:helicase-related protein n=2 Tax=Vibrio TaxID=662 RepID=UPI0035527773
MLPQEFIEARESLLEYVKSQLVGPVHGEEEEIKDAPHKRYLSGTLFPPAASRDESDESQDEESTTEALSNDFKPSSMAMSFAAQSSTVLEVTVFAANYTRDQQSTWKRKPLDFTFTLDLRNGSRDSIPIFCDNARIDVAIRPYVTGKIVTIALSNQTKSGEKLDPKDCFFQCQISATVLEGKFAEYPSSDRFKLDDEQKDLALTYRNRVPWGVGHGVAVCWKNADSERVPYELHTDVMPSHEVKGFTTDLDKDKFPELTDEMLNIHRIANVESVGGKELCENFRTLINAYSRWVSELEDEVLDTQYSEAKTRVLSRLKIASQRMLSGIQLLERDPAAMHAFRIANKAMLMQMIHSSSDFSGSAKKRDWGYLTPDYSSADKVRDFNWRPFQLAFQLLVLESLIPDDSGKFSESHDDVDLLWFPTGGGKTEAYLAVAAWEMIYRRLKFGSKGGGTSVIKRYTLRLLTSQQFQRAGSLICALEVLRQEQQELLGAEKFSLGLWVGSASAPNSFKDAHESFKKQREADEPENPFQLQVCPWCGTSIFPKRHSENITDYGVNCNPYSKFEFTCPSQACEFHNHLPIQVVDDGLYESPPSLLIGTIDKFARLTWKAEASAFFGKNGVRPPSLIIQDELHLISGPLGTIAGIYEAGFDSIIQSLAHKPKVIAATATIRSAGQQVNRLFGRNVAIFPPSGTDEADSFFSKEDCENPGRLYVGVMPAGQTGQTGLVQLGAALLQSPQQLGFADIILDSYWTLPIYHNSRRELGKTMTLARDDIPARIGVIANEGAEPRDIQSVEELSANVKGPRIPEILAKLEIEKTSSEEVVDVLPCTNMISVGVDIGRLGMMLIAGQPKATAEYIQASSRVGRKKSRPPGIVFTQYSATKPRDRSHYESFRSYHQALYRYVEPTSVTPWAMPAVERALHASLIALVRMSGHLKDNKSAKFFDKESDIFKKLRSIFEQRIGDSMLGMDESERNKVFDYLSDVIDKWHEKATCGESPINLYEAGGAGKQYKALFKPFDANNSNNEAWNTLNSMRSVDTETHILVRGESNV